MASKRLDAERVLKGTNYVWRLINLRQRSEKEIRDRLKLKGFKIDVIEEIVAYFKGLRLINDKEFALAWASSRRAKPLGFKVIELELEQKGITKEIIKEVIGEKRLVVDEAKVVTDLAGKRIIRLSKRSEPTDKIKHKVYTYLIQRGFSNDVVIDALDKLLSS